MSLPRHRILRARADFLKVRAAGQARPGRFLLLTAVPSGGTGPTRFGFITPKYVGKAHDRNLVRRRLRAIARAHEQGMPPEFDVVVLARRRVGEADYTALEREFLKLAGRAGLLPRAGRQAAGQGTGGAV